MKILRKIKNRVAFIYRRRIIHQWGIDRELYEKLYELIKNRNTVTKHGNNKNVIYVEMSWAGMSSDILKKMEFAFRLEQKTETQVFAICDKRRSQLTQLLRCAGIHLLFENLYWIKFPIECICSFFKAIITMLQIKSGGEMLQIHYKGILIGDCVYTDILRHASQVYTINKTMWKRDFPVLLKAFIYCNCIWAQFKKYPPQYYILGDYCYLQGIYVRIAQRYGAKLYDCVVSEKIVEIPKIEGECQPNSHDIIRYYIEQKRAEKKISTIEINQQVDELFYAKFHGKGNKDTVCAFAGKKDITLEELKKEMGLKPQYKNVIIMCHCFSDNAHSCDELIFNDYYVWLEETLKIVRNLKNANWIIRAHPSRRLYGESDEVQKLFEKYKSDYMFYFPEEYSGELVKELADVIVTVQGTAGYEYTCFGIPVVLTGKSFYSGYGYTVDMRTKEEYIDTLCNIQKLGKLNTKQINMAREIYYYREGLFEVKEPFDKLFYNNYQGFLKERDMEKWNNRMVSDYIGFLQENEKSK